MFFGTPPPPPEFPHSLDDMELTSEDMVFFNDTIDNNDQINIYSDDSSCISHTCDAHHCIVHGCGDNQCTKFSCENYDDGGEQIDPGECPTNT